MTTQEAIQFLRKSGSGDRLLNMLDKVADQLIGNSVSKPTLEEIQL